MLKCVLRSALFGQIQRIAPTQVAWFHGSRGTAAKQFLDKENQFAHNVLEQSLKPYQLFRMTDKDPVNVAKVQRWAESDQALAPASVNDVFRQFCAVGHYCRTTNTCFSDARFRSSTQQLCDACPSLSDDQLLEALRQLSLMPTVESVKAPNFVELWNTLDAECCSRVERWSNDQLLLVCDAWYTLGLARICDYVWEALRKLSRKVRRMRPEQLVQMMFLCNVMRRPLHEMFDFEVNLAQCVDDMTLQELAIMSMGFFKTQTRIRSPELLESLYRRLGAELSTVEDIALVAILKTLRYSTKLSQVNLLMQLLDSLVGQVDRLSLLSCLHVALLGIDMQCCNDDIVERILQRFTRDLAQTRLKDLERICLVIGLFNINTSSGVERDLGAQILTLLHTRIEEILKHPRCFPACLHYLTLKGLYDPELISSVLDVRFIHHAYGQNITFGREIFSLDSFTKINLTQYAGNQLSDKQRRTMGKMLTHYIPERNTKFKLTHTDRVLLEIKESTDRVVRLNTLKHVLPHFERPDVVICYDNAKRMPLALSPDCPEDYSGLILTRKALLGDLEASNIDTVVIVVAGWNNVVREKNRNTGLFDMKLTQLRLLGHKFIVIYWDMWRELETQSDRQNFIKRKLATVINV